jgi:hypothetical protein
MEQGTTLCLKQRFLVKYGMLTLKQVLSHPLTLPMPSIVLGLKGNSFYE